MKKTIKFILKMAVAALILCIAIYGVYSLVKPDSSNENLININNTLKADMHNSHKDFANLVLSNNSSYTGNDKVNYDIAVSMEEISDFLEEYYNYYINLTVFVKSSDGALAGKIKDNINSLTSLVQKTGKNILDVKNVTATNYTEKNSRLKKVFNSFAEQISLSFETCNLLKQYVYKTNYQTNQFVTTKEAVMEVILDYSKTVFDEAINENYNAQKSITLLAENGVTSWKSVLAKYNAMDNLDNNGSVEARLVMSYSVINKTFATEFYKNNTEATRLSYVNSSAELFTAPAVDGETELEREARELEGISQKNYVAYLYQYINQSTY